MAAIQNPAATVETVRPMADKMRQQMKQGHLPAAAQRQMVAGMATDTARQTQIARWGTASDSATTAQAMYDMYTIDLRNDVGRIQQPVLVLGAWAAYAQYGSTKESTRAIFTQQYALQAFAVNALDYLLKPVQEARLAAALAKARAHCSAPVPAAMTPAGPAEEAPLAPLTVQDQVFVKDGERCWFVKLADIKLFEINGSYPRIHFESHQPLIPRTLQQLEARLDPKVFFRVNRQQIINLKWIAGIEPWFSNTLKLKRRGGPEVEVSRQQSVRFRELLSL